MALKALVSCQLLLFLIICLICSARCLSPPLPAFPVVQAPSGCFIGDGSIPDLDLFLGIRYAEPPVGNQRFANPRAVRTSSNSTMQATAYGPGCLQQQLNTLYNGFGEDCLTLNIVRPAGIKPDAKLPVMFWIHGGGNTRGQSVWFNGTALVQHSLDINQPIIYIATNYRLAGFGFFTSPQFAASGLSNLGLKDQRLALEWVQENIASFQGDPRKITLFGESAGAANVWAHLHYAQSRNETGRLFQAAISQSGAPGSPQFPQALSPIVGTASYNDLLSGTNCSNSTNSINCLRSIPAVDIAPLLVNELVVPYTIDGDWFNDTPLSLVIQGDFASIPILHGANYDEGITFLPNLSEPPSRDSLITFVFAVLYDLAANFNSTELVALAQTIVSTYFDLDSRELGQWRSYSSESSTSTASNSTFWPALAIYSDLFVHLGRRAFLRRASLLLQPSVYGYIFTAQPPSSALNLPYQDPPFPPASQGGLGACHSAELSYVFGEVTGLPDRRPQDVTLSIQIMNAWVNFAYFHDPNGDIRNRSKADARVGTGPGTINLPYWPPYAKNEGTVMYLGDQYEGAMNQPGKDSMRQSVYDAWNSALRTMGILAELPLY